jgi:hypothetical protein
MVVYYVVTQKTTGEILRFGQCLITDLPLQIEDSDTEQVLQTSELINGKTHRIVNGDVVPRISIAFNKNTIQSNGTDTATVYLPAGSKLSFDGETTEFISSDTVSFNSTVPGIYNYSIQAPYPYIQITSGFIVCS